MDEYTEIKANKIHNTRKNELRYLKKRSPSDAKSRAVVNEFGPHSNAHKR